MAESGESQEPDRHPGLPHGWQAHKEWNITAVFPSLHWQEDGQEGQEPGMAPGTAPVPHTQAALKPPEHKGYLK